MLRVLPPRTSQPLLPRLPANQLLILLASAQMR